jgi:hypothetical protein
MMIALKVLRSNVGIKCVGVDGATVIANLPQTDLVRLALLEIHELHYSRAIEERRR